MKKHTSDTMDRFIDAIIELIPAFLYLVIFLPAILVFYFLYSNGIALDVAVIFSFSVASICVLLPLESWLPLYALAFLGYLYFFW
ncbi:hypothetical protein A4G18_07460 [Pasteurellaceae bacterium Pebbles2]|nr:hypothetical protein [Pasteurellaceae bacterium Pebbles2]